YIYTLSLHDALPICNCCGFCAMVSDAAPREVTLNQRVGGSSPPRPTKLAGERGAPGQKRVKGPALIQPILLFELARQVFLGEVRSEEHTSELQSPDH